MGFKSRMPVGGGKVNVIPRKRRCEGEEAAGPEQVMKTILSPEINNQIIKLNLPNKWESFRLRPECEKCQ